MQYVQDTKKVMKYSIYPIYKASTLLHCLIKIFIPIDFRFHITGLIEIPVLEKTCTIEIKMKNK